jgi:multicomponent K+:H+ antiporter subunit G
MRRLHGPTKAATLGIGALLIASMLYFLLARGHLSFHELLITIFVFLTAPVTALMVAKAHVLRDRDRRRELPPTGRPAGWATLDPPSEPQRQRSSPPAPRA